MSNYHEGPAIYRKASWGILVLCPYGHVLGATTLKDFAGSAFEASMAKPNTVRCEGALPEAGR